MSARLWLCLALMLAVAGCGGPGARAYLAGDASCIGAKIYADDRMIGQFEEQTDTVTSEKFAVAKGLSFGYENVPIIPVSAKRVRVVHSDGRELSTAVRSNPTELYGGASFDKMTFDLS